MIVHFKLQSSCVKACSKEPPTPEQLEKFQELIEECFGIEFITPPTITYNLITDNGKGILAEKEKMELK